MAAIVGDAREIAKKESEQELIDANYKVANIPPGAGMKEVFGMLSSAQQFDLATWLMELMEKAGIN